MSTCTFFGHHDCSEAIEPKLREALIELITQQGVNRFLVGNHGKFDLLVYRILCEVREVYANICISVVLAYYPTGETVGKYGCDAILPEGVEAVPKRFAISWRNKWMISQADYVVTCVVRSFGGAAQFADMAARKGKTVIELNCRSG